LTRRAYFTLLAIISAASAPAPVTPATSRVTLISVILLSRLFSSRFRRTFAMDPDLAVLYGGRTGLRIVACSRQCGRSGKSPKRNTPRLSEGLCQNLCYSRRDWPGARTGTCRKQPGCSCIRFWSDAANRECAGFISARLGHVDQIAGKCAVGFYC